MPNANYQKGVKLERDVVNWFKSVGCTAARTAGSHGKYDLYVIGHLDQISLGLDKLIIEKFRPIKGGWQRKGDTYTDTLYSYIVSDGVTMALFIQCKRKQKGDK